MAKNSIGETISNWFWSSPVGESIEDGQKQISQWAIVQIVLLAVIAITGIVKLIRDWNR